MKAITSSSKVRSKKTPALILFTEMAVQLSLKTQELPRCAKPWKRRELISNFWRRPKSFPSAIGLTIARSTSVWRGVICRAPILRRATSLRYRPKPSALKQTQDLSRVFLKAGDDAEGVHVARISSLTANQFGIADHLPMILATKALSPK